ncbi:TPA: type II toxin-antitoxin system RelE/ParE family toxin [Candidatus Woesearchaeota archaeon]|nr:type II toxin-antitoxin system RelE/ParE family toxin [Candidatus Woesearchaeota archaeon]
MRKYRLEKLIERLQELPESGNPLQHDMRGLRSARLPPFRVIYRLENDKIIFLVLEHRSRAYD